MDEQHGDPVTTARALVQERFPDARAAFLSGSAMTSRRTATSDLDVVVVVGDDTTDAPFRETTDVAGWLVELFVHTPRSLEHYRVEERERHRPVLDLMCADGLPLVGVHCDDVAAAARHALSSGPEVGEAEWQRRRYVITDLLDDLRGLDGTTGPSTAAEVAFVAARLLEEVTHAALLHHGAWVHTGKAAGRALAAVDAPLLQRLVAAHRDALLGRPTAMEDVVTQVLDDHGGPLRRGYRVAGVRS